ncbi:MAG: PTS sugar transporter subunit IIA [Candidatus Cloacimonetes bacterium]|nr:PTS sugar transporter subunit IIA [Candidatus Cloacimonadota bacterium]
MLSHYINKDLVIIEPQVQNKEELFEKMVNHLYNMDYILNKKAFLQALQDREDVSNTELMPGIALPHSRSDSVEKLFMSIVLIKDGLDFGNPDMGKAKIIFFFGTSDKFNKEYLQLLAKSARLLKIEEFRDNLLQCKEPSQVIQLLDEYDKPEDEAEESKVYYTMIITLHETHRLDDLLTSMVELGITNASLMESTSLSSKISLDIPVFSGMYFDETKKHKESKVIICLINDQKTAHRLAELLKENNLDFNKQGVGFIQIIETSLLIGNPDEEIEL